MLLAERIAAMRLEAEKKKAEEAARHRKLRGEPDEADIEEREKR